MMALETTQTQETLVGEGPGPARHVSVREKMAGEAVRAGLYAAGVDHDHIEGIADHVMEALRETEILGKSLKEIIGPIDPKARVVVEVVVFPEWVRGPTFKDSDWAPRTEEEADRISQALRAEFGGTVEHHSYVETSSFAVVSPVGADDIVDRVTHTVFFDTAKKGAFLYGSTDREP